MKFFSNISFDFWLPPPRNVSGAWSYKIPERGWTESFRTYLYKKIPERGRTEFYRTYNKIPEWGRTESYRTYKTISERGGPSLIGPIRRSLRGAGPRWHRRSFGVTWQQHCDCSWVSWTTEQILFKSRSFHIAALLRICKLCWIWQ